MTISAGEVKVRVNFEGGGNVGIVADKAARAIGNVDDRAKGLNRTANGVNMSFGQLGAKGVGGLEKFTQGLGRLGGIAGVVGGLALGLYEGFKALSNLHLDAVIRDMAALNAEVSQLTRGFVAAVNAGGKLGGIAKGAALATLQAQQATAAATGDVKGVIRISAQIAQFTAGEQAGTARAQAADFVRQRDEAVKNRIAAEVKLDITTKRLAVVNRELEQIAAKPIPRDPYGVYTRETRREQLQVEHAGLAGAIPGLTVAAQRTEIETEVGEKAIAGLFHQAAAQDVMGEAQSEAILAPPPQPRPSGTPRGGAGGPRGGGSPGSEFGTDIDWDALILDLEDFEEANNDAVYGSAAAWHELNAELERMTELDPIQQMAEGFTGFGDALGYAADAIAEFSPQLAAFGVAAQDIRDIWDGFAGAQFDVANAVTLSVGSILKAGAAQIKGERERAGVLALIEVGLGIATSFTNPPESLSHFAAAAALGLAAAGVGGSSGGSGKGKAPRPQRTLTTGGGGGSGSWVVNINAPFLASSQETAMALSDLMGRAT